ncbi:MAG: hypothetical protein Q6370_022010 [Candidatus Sigynarchaeota archaeon]
MNRSSIPQSHARHLASAQLAAAIGILVPQALTMQRSLKSPGIFDYIGIGVCWVLLPILVTLIWFKWRDSKFTTYGDAWCLSIGALVQSVMLVAWPATTMPSTLFFVVNGTLVTLTGGWIQSAIIGIALCLGVHAVVFSGTRKENSTANSPACFALAIGTGTALGGFGLLLATYFGWTMYLFPSILAWLAAGTLRFYQILKVQKGSQGTDVVYQAGREDKVPKPKDIPARLSGWAGAILAAIPVLLLSMNFQRHRYAAGYWFPLVLVGIASAGCVVASSGISIAFKKKGMISGNVGTVFLVLIYSGLITALCIDASLLIPLLLFTQVEAAAFFKSWLYLFLTCVSVVSCLPAIGKSLFVLSVHETYQESPGRALGRIFFSGTLLAVIMVVFLLEGTSMIYSWNFGDEEAWIVVAIAVGLGGAILAPAITLDIFGAVRQAKEKHR